MSGQDVKRQVMAALDFGIAGHGDELTEAATDALAPCVVLTREEAERIKHYILGHDTVRVYYDAQLAGGVADRHDPDCRRCADRALLTPNADGGEAGGR